MLGFFFDRLVCNASNIAVYCSTRALPAQLTRTSSRSSVVEKKNDTRRQAAGKKQFQKKYKFFGSWVAKCHNISSAYSEQRSIKNERANIIDHHSKEELILWFRIKQCQYLIKIIHFHYVNTNLILHFTVLTDCLFVRKQVN